MRKLAPLVCVICLTLLMMIAWDKTVGVAKAEPTVPQGTVTEEREEEKAPSIQTLAIHVEGGAEGFSAKLVVIVDNRGPRKLDEEGLSFLKEQLQEKLEEEGRFFNSFDKKTWQRVPACLVELYEEGQKKQLKERMSFSEFDWMSCVVEEVIVEELTLPPRN